MSKRCVFAENGRYPPPCTRTPVASCHQDISDGPGPMGHTLIRGCRIVGIAVLGEYGMPLRSMVTVLLGPVGKYLRVVEWAGW